MVQHISCFKISSTPCTQQIKSARKANFESAGPLGPFHEVILMVSMLRHLSGKESNNISNGKKSCQSISYPYHLSNKKISLFMKQFGYFFRHKNFVTEHEFGLKN